MFLCCNSPNIFVCSIEWFLLIGLRDLEPVNEDATQHCKAWADSVMDLTQDLPLPDKEAFIGSVIGMLCLCLKDFQNTLKPPPTFEGNPEMSQLLKQVSQQVLPKAIRALEGSSSETATALMSVPLIVHYLAPHVKDKRLKEVLKGELTCVIPTDLTSVVCKQPTFRFVHELRIN